MSMNILVTGGAGYLGSILVPELLSDGHKVTVLDNFMYGQNSLAHVCSNPHFDVINGDVRNSATMNPLLKKADVIIPLAAYVGAPLCDRDPVGATTTNKDAILWMFQNISPEQIVLMPTTNSAYGSGNKDNHCDETSPLNPISRYAKDKVEVEKNLLELKNSVSFRLATVFGMSPRMRIDLLVNDFAHRAVYDRFVVLFEGHFKRNYINIRDVTRVFQHGLKNINRMRGEIYNVGLSDANLSKFELCTAIKEHVPDFTFLEAPVGKDPDQRNYIVSNAKIEATGFSPKHSLHDGLRELVKGYRMIKNTKYGNV
jgi:nucleoside-diphosphate-sugar epimerase